MLPILSNKHKVNISISDRIPKVRENVDKDGIYLSKEFIFRLLDSHQE
jgi:hypothetical protein